MCKIICTLHNMHITMVTSNTRLVYQINIIIVSVQWRVRVIALMHCMINLGREFVWWIIELLAAPAIGCISLTPNKSFPPPLPQPHYCKCSFFHIKQPSLLPFIYTKYNVIFLHAWGRQLATWLRFHILGWRSWHLVKRGYSMIRK